MDEVAIAVLQALKGIKAIGPEIEAIGFETRLLDIPLNSLTFVQFVVEIENTMKIEFSDADLDFSRYQTIGDLISHITHLTA